MDFDDFRTAGNGDFSLGSKVWPGLSKLIEEAGEVAELLPDLILLKVIGKLQQTAGKLIQTAGAAEHWDGRGDLHVRVGEEVVDLFAAARAFFQLNGYDGNPELMVREDTKYHQFLNWHAELVAEPEDKVTEVDPPAPDRFTYWRHADGGIYKVTGHRLVKDEVTGGWNMQVEYDHADGNKNPLGLPYGTSLKRWYARFTHMPQCRSCGGVVIEGRLCCPERSANERDHGVPSTDPVREFLREERAADLGFSEYPDPNSPTVGHYGCDGKYRMPLRTSTAPTDCMADRDGDCKDPGCPQLRDGEPAKSGRHCPLDDGGDNG